MSQITVVANAKVKKEFINEVYLEIKKLHKATHANDKGCIQYDAHKNIEDENVFTFIETWASIEDLEEHSKKEHFLDFVKNIEGKIESLEVNKLIKQNI